MRHGRHGRCEDVAAGGALNGSGRVVHRAPRAFEEWSAAVGATATPGTFAAVAAVAAVAPVAAAVAAAAAEIGFASLAAGGRC